MSAFLYLVFVILVVVVGSFGIIFVIAYFKQNKGDNIITLSFKEFYKYYRLCPERWTATDTYLSKQGNNYKLYYCRIKFTSYWRYLLFIWELEQGKKSKVKNKTYIQFLQDTQQDIDECKAKAKKYIDEGIDILNKM